MGQKPKRRGSIRRIVTSVPVLVLVGLALAWWQRQFIYDHLRLMTYTPPTAVAQLATDDTMTGSARRMYYVNHPMLKSRQSFSSFCPNGTEQTVVLGCYIDGQRGIYLLQVDNSELQGVEQVTAAHEMLHAAYDRLNASERQRIDGLLQNYYQHGLTDQTIKGTIAAYQKSEPNDVVNEMHSVFGSEVADLPQPLEQYYRQYFSDRSKVTDQYAHYEQAFTSRQQKIRQYDQQLTSEKQQISQLQSSVSAQSSSLQAKRSALESSRASGNYAQYNAGVDGYNAAVKTYNANVEKLRSLITDYNQLVEARNSIAFEEQQLVQAITSKPSPTVSTTP